MKIRNILIVSTMVHAIIIVIASVPYCNQFGYSKGFQFDNTANCSVEPASPGSADLFMTRSAKAIIIARVQESAKG